MVMYNTGNPVGSTQPKDLSDNAQVLDKLAVGTDPSVVDRLGNLRYSWAGMEYEFRNAQDGREVEFQAFLEASGYVFAGDYGAGITLTTRTQYLVRDGVLYRVAPSTTLPYTTTGNWALEQSNFVAFDTDNILQQDLADNTDPTKGAALVGRAVRHINSVAELRTVPGRYDGDTAYLTGYHAAFNGHGGGPVTWFAGSAEADDSFTTFAAAGGVWKRADIGNLNVLHAGAIYGQESSDAAQRVADWIKVRGWGTLDFGETQFFLFNKPVRLYQDTMVTGKAILRAQAPFTGVAVDNFTGGTTTIAALFFMCDAAPTSPSGTIATIYNPTGSRRQNVEIGSGIQLDCRDIADYGVFTDNYQYLRIHCRVRAALKWGVRLNFFGWSGEVSSRISGCAEGGLWIGAGCNGMSFDNLFVWGDDKTPTVAGILIDGDNNGLSLAGATVEKVKVGVLARNGCGPVDISGVDFEQCVDNVLVADGTGVPSRVNGPITIQGSFLEVTNTTTAIISATNSIVIAKGCRARNAARFIDQVGAGYVVDEDNMLASTVLARGTGHIHTKTLSGRAAVDAVRAPVSTTLATVREITNYGYPYADIPTSGLNFSHQVTSGTNRTMVGTSTWYTANQNLDVETVRMGLNLDLTTGTKAVTPLLDNDQSLGSIARRNSVVYAGTGAISTSDGREKTEVRALNPAEIEAAKEIAKEIGAYRWLASVQAKGADAREHVGLTVQKAIAILQSHELDPFGYGFICYDKWGSQDAVVEQTRVGNVLAGSEVVYEGVTEDWIEAEGLVWNYTHTKTVELQPALPAGDRYSFRYDELNLFIAAGFEARLSALEAV